MGAGAASRPDLGRGPGAAANARERGSLRLPTNLAADIEGRLAVSDTGHDRVLFGHMAGNTFDVQKVIGRGEPGFDDGPLVAAAFRGPHGLTLSGDILIVADHGNHAIRMVDLATGEVATMAGRGELEAGPIRSPWDVLLHDYDLFIAMGESRQIWRLSLKERELVLNAATGAETMDDRPAAIDRLAQPMALATDGKALYLADAESSNVRRVPFEPGGEVETLVGTGTFAMGDVDGVGEQVRLRHAAGLAWGQGNHRFWIADTHNHKLKTLDPHERRVEAVEPFEEKLEAPMGLASAGHFLFVADTSHHRILRVDQIDKRVVELEVDGA